MRSIWRTRWEKTHADLVLSRAESDRLRDALNQLNEEVEDVLNAVGQSGHEAAKSWLIKQQRSQIRGLQKRAASQ